MAETAWSHAMEKRQLPDGPNASHRIYLIGKLRKAVKWADLFLHLCSVKGDSRISLEAEVLIAELKTLYDKCISYSCTEHATGIIEEKKALGNVYH